jgi:hypothetical protein
MNTEIPQHHLQSITLYVEKGYQPGSFLTAVLTNDLKGAVSYGDAESLAALPAIVRYCYSELPWSVWGSAERVSEHLDFIRRLQHYPYTENQNEVLCRDSA